MLYIQHFAIRETKYRKHSPKGIVIFAEIKEFQEILLFWILKQARLTGGQVQDDILNGNPAASLPCRQTGCEVFNE